MATDYRWLNEPSLQIGRYLNVPINLPYASAMRLYGGWGLDKDGQLYPCAWSLVMAYIKLATTADVDNRGITLRQQLAIDGAIGPNQTPESVVSQYFTTGAIAESSTYYWDIGPTQNIQGGDVHSGYTNYQAIVPDSWIISGNDYFTLLLGGSSHAGDTLTGALKLKFMGVYKP